MAGLYVNGWEPESNGISSSPWARREDQKDTSSGADICWDHQGRVEPLTLKEFSIEEKEVCLLLSICFLANISSCFLAL